MSQVDSFGALVAGLAMGWAILSLYIAWRLMGGSTSAGISLNFAGPVIVVSLNISCRPLKNWSSALHAANVLIPGT